MTSTEINIMDEEPSVLVFSGVGSFELVLGSVSVTMTPDQFDKLIEQMTPWIVEPDAALNQRGGG